VNIKIKFEEKIYNTDNLSIKDIDKKITRAGAILLIQIN